MSLFRCAGDIIFDNVEPLPGQICNVRLKQFSETCNFLQHLSPLTPEHPYFFAQIRALAPFSKITLGIAGPDIAEDAHPGDVFGVLVTYFGQTSSTVIFLKNGSPVATRFLFESDQNQFLPTISLQHGPIDLGLMWPEAAMGVPQYSEKNMLHWIRPPYVIYDMENNQFVYDAKEPEAIIQSPLPLSTEIQHFEVIIKEVSNAGGGPAIALATCSPLIPSPSCSLSKDYLRFLPEGNTSRVSIDMETNPRPVGLISALDEQFAKVQKGAEKIIAEDRLARASCAVRRGDLVGWGVLYLDDSLHHDEEQLVVCYLTVNRKVLLVRVMFQPPGGFYPLVILPQGVNRVQMEFGATVIKEHPITEDDVKILLHDTQKMIAEENEAIAQGRDPHELHFEESLLFRPLPSANRADEQNSGSMAKNTILVLISTVRTIFLNQCLIWLVVLGTHFTCLRSFSCAILFCSVNFLTSIFFIHHDVLK
nr:hypothetical protein BaRGS_009408 [Batillaria attramentaria]